MLFRARRPIKMDGKWLKAGDTFDPASATLPPGRLQKLVDLRFGEYVAEEQNLCEECGKPFDSPRSLAIHKGRAHRGETEE